MNLVFAMLQLLLFLQPTSFDESLSIRDFQSALRQAEGNDSLAAMVFLESGDCAMAASLFSRIFNLNPSPGSFSLMWESISSSTDNHGELVSPGLREELRNLGDSLEWGPQNLLSLIETSEALGDSALEDSLASVLLDDHPVSEEAYQVLGWLFYDGLYPVWYDDSARIQVLDDFIAEYGRYSDIWRSRAWNYRLSAQLGTADSVDWHRCLDEWLRSCPRDPLACLAGSGEMIDRDSSYQQAFQLARRGLGIMDSCYRPVGMPREEWNLMDRAIRTGLEFRRLQAFSHLAGPVEAISQLDSVIGSIDFDIDDYHTKADLYLLQGEINLSMGDTASALMSFAASVSLGDVNNRWSGKALEKMGDILFPETSPLKWARDSMGYSGPVFVDVTGLLGPDSLLQGSRVSWCDWNMDGYPDLYAGSHLYQNQGGTDFQDITAEAGLEGCDGNGGIWGDIDRNGFPDLVTCGNPPRIFLNDGETMREATEALGVMPTGASVEGIGMLDWNADGWLDLYLASYEEPGGRASGTRDAFYLGGPEGFRDVGDSLGMIPFLGRDRCGRGVSPCDMDRDGDMDIFVSNYRLQENFLWENEDGSAFNSALARGVAGHDDNGWWGHTIGSSWCDYDCDGDWDLFSANLAHPRYITFSDRSMLLRNDDGQFTDARSEAGIKFEETLSNPLWGDFNNDGFPDLYVTSIYENRRSYLYLNRGDGTFLDVTWLSGTRVFNGWGAAAADFNMDGRLDLAVGTGQGPVLLMNVSKPGNWVLVRIHPPPDCNTSGLGCNVVITQDSCVMMRQVSGGSGTTSQDCPTLHFGLPGNTPFTLDLFVPGDAEPVLSVEGTVNRVVDLGI